MAYSSDYLFTTRNWRTYVAMLRLERVPARPQLPEADAITEGSTPPRALKVETSCRDNKVYVSLLLRITLLFNVSGKVSYLSDLPRVINNHTTRHTNMVPLTKATVESKPRTGKVYSTARSLMRLCTHQIGDNYLTA